MTSGTRAPGEAQGQALPRWDMTPVYPGLDSAEFERGFAAVAAAIADLGERFDEHDIALRAGAPPPEEAARVFDALLPRYHAVLEQAQTLAVYIACFVNTDARDDLAQARQSELRRHLTALSQIETRFTAWVGGLDLEALLARSELARDHAYPLRLIAEEAAHLMSPAEEALAAELNQTGGGAWSRLHGNISSRIVAPVDTDGAERELPMSAVRNLAYDPDRATRRSAYQAELAVWQAHAVPLAAALNGIKGEVLTLAERRGWASPLDESLFHNHIDRATLDAMLGAARAAFPDFRRYLRAKARALGLDELAWFDIFAPVGQAPRVWTYPGARDFIVARFGDYSPRLGGFAARAFDERWIDAEPRAGKRDGAYCAPLRGDESRILANFKAAYGGMNTLAHELGHGYHNLCKAGRTPLNRATPMTLAETASIFCETIVREAALAQSDPAEQLAILEASLQSACQVTVDITSRFVFEQRLFEGRARRELSVDELNALMLDAQRETYGDGLDDATLHPSMWAVKPHYYSTGRSFYNYPYMFGLLFGVGLYTRYRQDPERFVAGYDDLLASTGLADAATLAQRFGLDIRDAAFWQASLATITSDIDRFEALVDAGG